MDTNNGNVAQLSTGMSGVQLRGLEKSYRTPRGVLAWAVREGTTNVVRHSDAAHCSIRVHRAGESAEVEIEDDGSARRNGSNGGSGLIGLAERAQAIRGTVEAGSRPEGGFRLRVTVPLGEA
jgi:two-component system sensor histidine kinase DesK